MSELFLGNDEFEPQGATLGWEPALVTVHLITESMIGLAYVAISLSLIYLARKAGRSIPFLWAFVAFGLFIISCSVTHFLGALTLWEPLYWLAEGVNYVTAVASVGTAIVVPPLVPKVLELVDSARLSEERRRRLETANEDLESLNGKLKDLDQLKTRFFANVSHELRTPLTLILGPTQKLLSADGLSGDQRRDLEVVERNAHTLLKHVNDLLDVSRLEAGKMSVDYAEVDLARLVRLGASHFDTLARDRGISFSVEAPRGLSAQADPEKLQRVLLNLLSNAFKFTPDGGVVCCVLDAGRERAVISVRDSGPGVKPELREAIFERFRQGDGGDTRRFGGTGLGLAITRDFVELHGGTITVDNAPEGGALFRVELPLLAPPDADVHVPASETEDAEESARQTVEELRTRAEDTGAAIRDDDQPIVLVVEDNPEMNRFITETLAPEYRAVTALDGQEGLEKTLTLRPDLILTDMMMPRMSGEQLLREVRTRPELDSIPVVLLTARADDALRVRLLREGAQDYLVKPFLAEELRARVARLVAMKRARDLLQRELASQSEDVAALAGEVASRKRDLETALGALRQSENLYRTVVEQAAENIFLVDAGTKRIIEANAALAHSLGYTTEELRSMTLHDIIAEDRETVDSYVRQILEDGEHFAERHYRRKDGSLADVEVSVSAIAYEGTEALCIVAHDVTERKRAERALKEIRDTERHRIARDIHDGVLQDMAYTLQAMEVTRMKAEGTDLEEEMAEEVGAMRTAAGDLRRAVYDLRLGDERNRPLPSFMQALVEQSRQRDPECEIELQIQDRVPAAPLEDSGTDFLRIIQEALTNVRRHSEARRVLVSLKIDGEDVVAEVADDGRGFGPAAVPGVGTRSMRERAAALGGDLRVESEPGRGTRVRLRVAQAALFQEKPAE